MNETGVAALERPAPIFRGILHYIDGDRLFISQGATIIVASLAGASRILVKLPVSTMRARLGTAHRLAERALRQGVYHIVPFKEKLIVFAFGRIWCVDLSTGTLIDHSIPIVGRRPLVICATSNSVYYGEYRSNPERGCIRLLKSLDGSSWEVVCSFENVRHIHGVFRDPYSDALWVTTGDTNEESMIIRSFDEFSTMDIVLSGTQQARAIPLLFSPDAIYFGSDTPEEQNFLYRLDRSSGTVEVLGPVDGSVFHAAKVGNRLLFSTAVEPSKINRKREAVLYASSDGFEWKAIVRHQKDVWSMKLFQYGQLILPAGTNETNWYLYSTSAVDGDHNVYAGKICQTA